MHIRSALASVGLRAALAFAVMVAPAQAARNVSGRAEVDRFGIDGRLDAAEQSESDDPPDRLLPWTSIPKQEPVPAVSTFLTR